MNAQSAESTGPEPHVARDPVCGQDVAMTDGALTEDYAGVVYFFSSQACLDRFNQDADIFTIGEPDGTPATHDRGQRVPFDAAGYSGHVLFEVASVGAGPG
jgi:YHS domain-containing protein